MSTSFFEGSTPSRTRRTSRPKRLYFSVSQAERSLPLVRQVLGDVVRLTSRCLHLSRQFPESEAGSRDWADACRRFSLIEDYQASKGSLADCESELADVGAKMLSSGRGIVGFPTIVNGALAYLVYFHEDEAIKYWRYIDQPKLREIPSEWREQTGAGSMEGLLI